jgi:hypothetical protein
MTGVIGNQTRIHRGSALRFDAAFQLLRSPWRPRGHVTPPSIFSRAPHISRRTDDTPWKMVYFIIHTGMANARVPPLAAISE